MRLLSIVLGAVVLCACHQPPADDGRSEAQRKTAAKTDQAAKKGALIEKDDPAADLKKQKANLERLRSNEAGAREAGNRIAAWAARQDARHVEKLITKDEELLAVGTK